MSHLIKYNYKNKVTIETAVFKHVFHYTERVRGRDFEIGYVNEHSFLYKNAPLASMKDVLIAMLDRILTHFVQNTANRQKYPIARLEVYKLGGITGQKLLLDVPINQLTYLYDKPTYLTRQVTPYDDWLVEYFAQQFARDTAQYSPTTLYELAQVFPMMLPQTEQEFVSNMEKLTEFCRNRVYAYKNGRSGYVFDLHQSFKSVVNNGGKDESTILMLTSLLKQAFGISHG